MSRTFDDVCKALFAYAGLPEPDLPSDEDLVSVGLRVGSSDVQLLHFPQRRPRMLVVLVALGKAPAEHEPDVLLELLSANFALTVDPHNSAYSRNAATGELFFQCEYALDDVDAEQLHAAIVNLAGHSAGGLDDVVTQAISAHSDASASTSASATAASR